MEYVRNNITLTKYLYIPFLYLSPCLYFSLGSLNNLPNKEGNRQRPRDTTPDCLLKLNSFFNSSLTTSPCYR